MVHKVGVMAVFDVSIFTNNAKTYIKTINRINNVTKKVAGGMGFVGHTISTALGNALARLTTYYIPRAIGKLRDFVSESIAVGADFQDQMAIVATAVSDPTVSMDELSESAIAVGNDTSVLGASAVGAAEAMQLLFKGGLSVNEVFGDMQGYLAGNVELGGALRGVFDLMAASGLTVEQASDAAVVSLATFGKELETEEERAAFVNRAFDNMVRSANASVSEVDNIIESLRYVGPAANTAGLELEDVTNALALLSNAGMQGSIAGTSLNAMLTDLTETTNKSKAEMEELGITLYDDKDALLPLIDIVGQFEVALEGMTDRQRIESLGKIFDVRGARAMNALLQEGVSGWNDMAEAVHDASGMQEQAAVRMDTLRGQTEILDSTVETLKIQIEDGLDEALKLAVSIMNEVVQRVGPPLIEFFSKVGLVAQAAFKIFQDEDVRAGIKRMFDAITEGDFMETFVQLKGVLDSIFGEEIATDMLEGIFPQLQKVVEFGPKISELFDRLSEEKDFSALMGLGFIFDQIFGTEIGMRIATITTSIIGFFTSAREKGEEFSAKIDPIIQNIKAMALTVKEFLQPIFEIFVNRIQQDVIPQLQEAWETLKDIFGDQTLQETFTKLATGIVVAITTILAVVAGLAAGVAAAINSIVSGVQMLREGWQQLGEFLSGYIEAIKLMLQGRFVEAFRVGLESVQNLWKAFGNIVRGLIQSLVISVLNLVARLVTSILNFFKDLKHELVGGSIIPDMVNAILDWFNTLISSGVQLIKDFVSGIVNTIKSLPDKFKEILNNVIGVVKGMASRFRGVGEDLINGLKDGIKAKASAIVDAAKGIVSNAVQAAKNLLGERSPSRVFMEIGENISIGMAQGIANAMRAPMSAVGGLVSNVARVASPGTTGGNVTYNEYNVEMNPTYRNYQSEAGVFYDTVAALSAVRN